MIRHLACIMDGNRRWARSQQWLPWFGHKEGIKAAQRVADFCIARGIPTLTLYTFSQENFNRPQEELAYLFGTLPKEFHQTVMNDFIAKGIKVQLIGDRSLFPESVIPFCDEIEEKTRECKSLLLNLLFCYGGRQEIAAAVKQLVHDVQEGIINQETIDQHMIERYLWTADLPEPELIIRTGGAQRLSNFFLYKAAYSELFFLDCFWPEINEHHLQRALAFYEQCQRNFGT